jgi:2-haloacid dehalogenase
MDFSRFSVLLFDCYGTLIDWESGLLQALRPVFSAHLVRIPDEKALSLFAELEAEAEKGEFQIYKEVLKTVLRGFGEHLKFTPYPGELQSFALSVGDWKPFSDTVAALKQLKRRFRLGILSNVDDDLFAHSAQALKVPFDWVITAQQVGSYKPDLNNFRLALQRIGLPQAQVLHVAQSLYHDIQPAHELGLATVWVNRRVGKNGSGATFPAQATPDLEIPDLATLARLSQ